MNDIAIIDTGISLNYFDNVVSLESNINFSDINNVCEDNIPSNVITHGTICASIIKTYAPSAPLHSLNVFINGVSKLESIIAAIRYCLKRNIKIINMSFGTNYVKNDIELKEVIQLAIDQGTIIISSASKNGIVTFPSHYRDVISVGVKTELPLMKNRVLINGDYLSSINVFACGIQRLYKDAQLIYITPNEPSYATAVVTALIYNALNIIQNKGTNSRTVLELLANNEFGGLTVE